MANMVKTIARYARAAALPVLVLGQNLVTMTSCEKDEVTKPGTEVVNNNGNGTEGNKPLSKTINLTFSSLDASIGLVKATAGNAVGTYLPVAREFKGKDAAGRDIVLASIGTNAVDVSSNLDNLVNTEKQISPSEKIEGVEITPKENNATFKIVVTSKNSNQELIPGCECNEGILQTPKLNLITSDDPKDSENVKKYIQNANDLARGQGSFSGINAVQRLSVKQ
jgi:hypothetical protein